MLELSFDLLVNNLLKINVLVWAKDLPAGLDLTFIHWRLESTSNLFQINGYETQHRIIITIWRAIITKTCLEDFFNLLFLVSTLFSVEEVPLWLRIFSRIQNEWEAIWIGKLFNALIYRLNILRDISLAYIKEHQ